VLVPAILMLGSITLFAYAVPTPYPSFIFSSMTSIPTVKYTLGLYCRLGLWSVTGAFNCYNNANSLSVLQR